MSLEHTPLDIGSLSTAAQKAVAPGPVQMMAARGLAPLPDPADLVAVLYQLAITGEAAVANAANQSFADLPDNIATGAFKSESLDPRVLDYAADKLAAKHRTSVLQVIVLNQATADVTIAGLAARVDAATVDLISQNEQRLLRCPEIIGSMYRNRLARMSTVDRAVELAIFNEIKVPGIPAWEELTQAVKTSGKRGEEKPAAEHMDAVFQQAAPQKGGEITEAGEWSESEEAEEQKEIPLHEMTVPMKIRLASLGNKFMRGQLIRDPIRMVALATIKAPGVTDAEAAKYAGNNQMHEDVIAYIARNREWTKMQSVKSALIKNPKTPLPTSMRLLPHLREKELRLIAKSKGVPTALAAAARKLVQNRSGGSKK